MELEKTIVYFKASLKTNDVIKKKGDQCHQQHQKCPPGDEDLLEDALIEAQQAIADIYEAFSHDRYSIDHLQQPEQS